jgi:hypothetical protein
MDECMCKYCDYNSNECCIFIDSLDGNYYLDILTWNAYDDDIAHQRNYINYCPWCGRKLKGDK